jgi:hypothetical protein
MAFSGYKSQRKAMTKEEETKKKSENTDRKTRG